MTDVEAAHALAAAIWDTTPDRPHPWDELTAQDQADCAALVVPLVPAFEKVIAAFAGIASLIKSPSRDGLYTMAEVMDHFGLTESDLIDPDEGFEARQ